MRGRRGKDGSTDSKQKGVRSKRVGPETWRKEIEQSKRLISPIKLEGDFKQGKQRSRAGSKGDIEGKHRKANRFRRVPRFKERRASQLKGKRRERTKGERSWVLRELSNRDQKKGNLKALMGGLEKDL